MATVPSGMLKRLDGDSDDELRAKLRDEHPESAKAAAIRTILAERRAVIADRRATLAQWIAVVSALASVASATAAVRGCVRSERTAPSSSR